MKKVISMTVKPLAIATAFAAGTTASMIATALPGGGDTLGAVKVVNESICKQSVNMTISGGSRSVTTGTGTCQLRTLPPTQGLVLTESSPAGGTTADSSAMVNAGGELYETFVAGKRSGATLLTPNRALATSHAVTYASGSGGSLSVDFAASVQPVSGLQSNWLVGTYRILNSIRANGQVADGIEKSAYADPNYAMGKLDYTSTFQVKFNGDNTCTVQDVNSHWAAGLYRDPLLNGGVPEMDVACTAGGGGCGQNDGNNYVSHGVIDMGTTGSVGNGQAFDWNDTYSGSDGVGLYQESCTYSVNAGAGQVTVNYGFTSGDTNDVPSMSHVTWASTYNVSSDLRYLVSDGVSATEGFKATGFAYEPKGGISVGVRQGSPTLVGNTYLFNARDGIENETTSTTASYEAPVSAPYQDQQCFSTGSLALAAAGACTVNVVSTCSGRKSSGYEENTSVGLNGGAPTVGAGSGTIKDALTVFNASTAPTCSWSGTAANLVVNVAAKDANGGDVTMQYTGSASDNGEALVLQGIYNLAGAGLGDTTNTPILPIQRYNMESAMVAQQYQGSLTADADSNGTNNFGEFTQVTNTGSNTVRSDFNADGTSDIFMRDDGVSSFALNLLMSNGDRNGANGIGYTSTAFHVVGFADINGDGRKDVILQDDGSLGNIIIGQLMGEGGALTANVLVGYTDGNEVVDLVQNLYQGAPGLLFKTSGGIYFTKTLKNSAFADFAQVGSGSMPGTFVYKGMGDLDGNGEKDVVFLDTAQDRFFGYKRANNAFSGLVDIGGGASGIGFSAKGVMDINGDGRADIVGISTGLNQIFALEPDSTGGNGTYVQLAGVNSGDQVLAVDDLDGNGTADVLVSSSALGQVLSLKFVGGALNSYNTILYSTALNFKGMGKFIQSQPNDLGIVWTTAGGDVILSHMAGAALDHHLYLGTFDPNLIVHME
ncbi:MAG TPA: VCBS repeat-containing protein [Pseudomonadales bacterium]|nr:VCBS repeat-containing protein [Pseudomonadales bacterium]